MTKSEQINELAVALVKAQAEIKHAPTLSENPYFKSKYADLPTVIDTAKPILTKHGLAVVQTVGGINDTINITTLLMHTSGQWISDTVNFKPQKPGIQDAGAVITYLRRYSYAAITGIASEEDDDGNAHDQPINGKKKAEVPVVDISEAREKTLKHLRASTLDSERKKDYEDMIAKAVTRDNFANIYKAITDEAKTLAEVLF